MSRIKTKVYALGNRRKLTLAGRSNKTWEGASQIGIKIAMAIRNPDDDYKKDLGVTIAKNRLEHPGDHTVFESTFDTLKDSKPLDYVQGDILELQMDVVAEFIKKNLDKFV